MDGGSAPERSILDDWMTRPEVAEVLGVKVDTLRRWESRRMGPPCAKVGAKVLYRKDAFRDWLRSKERAPASVGGR